jgi:peptide/nickel transport system substrate-binding protein
MLDNSGAAARPAVHLSRRQLLRGAAVAGTGFGIAGLLAACGASPGTAVPTAPAGRGAAPPAAPGGGRAGDQLVIGSLEEPGSLSALVDLPHHFPEHVPQTLLFDSLTQFMPDGSVAPKLAERWTVSPDNLVYTFTLAAGARFHDGRPVTADDVKFTIETALDPASKSSTEGFDAIEKVEVADPRTIAIALKEVTPMFLAQGGARGIVPKHVLAGKDASKDEFNKQPVGSGPYRLVAYTPGQAVVLEAVPDYYRGAPAIKRVVFKILTEQNVVLTQLRAGELGYALITPRDLAAVSGIPGVKIVEAPTPRFFDITPNYARAYWQEQPVREAVLTAIDRQGIVDKVLLGHGKVIESNVAPGSWAFNPDLPQRPFDPTRARALLDGAGWRPGGDGVRAKGGQRLAFTTLVNNYDRTLEQALLVAQQNLRDVGVAMQLERVEPGVFGARRRTKDYDALSRVWNPVYDPDQTGLVKTGNFYGYANPKVDELSAQALGTTERGARKGPYAEIQRLLAADVARLFLYTENELHALSAGLTGPQPHPVNFFWNLKDWQPGG